MATAAIDVVGYLSAPGFKGNRAAADILEGQLFAYGVASGVAVVEVSGDDVFNAARCWLEAD